MERENYGKLILYAIEFQQQIRQKQRTAGDRKWVWETYIPGPINIEDAEIIMGIAGCWCYDPDDNNVKFYTNQNHPKWSIMNTSIEERGAYGYSGN